MPDDMLRPAAVLLLVALASGDTWQDAVRARDYERAAQLLHPILVAADDYTLRGQDPMPARQLAVMYAQGLGVPRDPVGACALAITARFPVENSAPRFARDITAYEANRAQAANFVDQHCEGLLPQDVVKATTAVGCFAFAMPEEVFVIGDRRVRVGRSGIGLEDAPDDRLAALVHCPFFIARVRATTVSPPAGATPSVVPRHVIEVFAWTRAQDPKTKTGAYALMWYAYELSGTTVALNTMSDLLIVPEWPRTPLLTDADARVSMEMALDGRVRWRLDGTDVGSWLRTE